MRARSTGSTTNGARSGATMEAEALADLDGVDAATPADAFTHACTGPVGTPASSAYVAARIKDRLHRPAVVFARADDGTLRGSGRSITGFHLRDALDLVAKRVPGAIARFGGHAYAAGLTLAERALPAFADAFEAVAREQLTPAQLARAAETDGALGVGELTLSLARALRDAVWGQGFAGPTFDDVFDVGRQRVVGERHLRVDARAGRRALRRHHFPAGRPAASARACGVPAPRPRLEGRGVGGDGDRALAARDPRGMTRRVAVGRPFAFRCSKFGASPTGGDPRR